MRGEVAGRRLAGGWGPGPRRRWQEARWRRGATAIGATGAQETRCDGRVRLELGRRPLLGLEVDCRAG